MKTKEQIIKTLEDGGMVSVHVWSFLGTNMTCWHGNSCCIDSYDSIEDTANAVMLYSRKEDLSDVVLN